MGSRTGHKPGPWKTTLLTEENPQKAADSATAIFRVLSKSTSSNSPSVRDRLQRGLVVQAGQTVPGGSWAAQGHAEDAFDFNFSQLSLTLVLGNVGRIEIGF